MEETVGSVRKAFPDQSPSVHPDGCHTAFPAIRPGRGIGILVPLLICLLFACLLQGQTLQLDPGKILSQVIPSAPTVAPVETIAQGYLYLEPNQMRFEVLYDAATVLAWAKQPIPASLDAASQKALTDALAAKSEDWCRLGTAQLGKGTFLGASIIKGKPGATLPFEEGATLPVRDAMVGLIWEFPLPPAPDEVLIQWSGTLNQSSLPIRIFYGTKSETVEAAIGGPPLRWRAKGKLPMPGPLAAVPKINLLPPWQIPAASLIWFTGGLVFFLWVKLRGHRLPGGAVAFLGAWLLGALLTWPLFVVKVSRGLAAPPVNETAAAEAILSPLLRNVYRAFDYRSESDIYDTLARSVDGELLRQLYLETLQALTLEGREGTRVTITEFSAEVMAVKENPAGAGFVTDCQWTALGTVGHWGHAHTRVNRYTAQVTVAPVKSEWKIVKLEVREARRI